MILQVEESGVLGLTQQLNNISSFNDQPASQSSTAMQQPNPFALASEALPFEAKPVEAAQSSRSAFNVGDGQPQFNEGDFTSAVLALFCIHLVRFVLHVHDVYFSGVSPTPRSWPGSPLHLQVEVSHEFSPVLVVV